MSVRIGKITPKDPAIRQEVKLRGDYTVTYFIKNGVVLASRGRREPTINYRGELVHFANRDNFLVW